VCGSKNWKKSNVKILVPVKKSLKFSRKFWPFIYNLNEKVHPKNLSNLIMKIPGRVFVVTGGKNLSSPPLILFFFVAIGWENEMFSRELKIF
jgi:hypothetical protein